MGYKVKHRRGRPGDRKKRVIRNVLITLAVILVLLGAGLFAGYNYYNSAMKLKGEANMLKSSLALCLSSLKTGDTVAADNAIAVIDETSHTMRQELEKSKWKIPCMIPKIGQDFDTCIMCLDLVDKASETLLKPASAMIKQSGMPTADIIDLDNMGPELGDKLYQYADMIDALCPAIDSLMTDLESIPAFNTPQLEEVMTKYRSLPAQTKETMPLIERMPSEFLRPAADVMCAKPFSSLKADGGIDTTVILAYMELEDEIRPFIGEVQNELSEGTLLKDNPDQQAKLTNKLDEMAELLDKLDRYEPLMKAFIGDGTDKMYLIVAQNSAELRACGGFPGQVGTVTIEDGILRFGDFTSVVNVIPQDFDPSIEFEPAESDLFLDNWYIAKARSASANPHFPRVAEIWASSYALDSGITPDGVISLTPHIIQSLMAITGPVTLSNGVTLDQDYCVWYLQHDVYFEYFGDPQYRGEANDITDALFAETANAVEDKLMEDPSIKNSLALLEILEASSDDRVFMMWMADETEQETVRQLGYSGSLNYDPENPEIGVFYSINAANRLGPYVNLDVQVGEGTETGSGEVTYPVTVTLKNTIDDATVEFGRGNGYLTSSRYAGDMKSVIYFFAPAGGSIDPVENDADIKMSENEYMGLDVFYNTKFYVKPGETVVFTYNVTCQAGTEPVVRVTPTLTEYNTEG